jgi:hypothetical protein
MKESLNNWKKTLMSSVKKVKLKMVNKVFVNIVTNKRVKNGKKIIKKKLNYKEKNII